MSDAFTGMNKSQVIIGGLYKHFKGGLYAVLGTLKDSGDPEDVTKRKVAYMNLDSGTLYHRDMHGEDGFLTPKIPEIGKIIERFVFCGYATVTLDRKGRYHVTREY